MDFENFHVPGLCSIEGEGGDGGGGGGGGGGDAGGAAAALAAAGAGGGDGGAAAGGDGGAAGGGGDGGAGGGDPDFLEKFSAEGGTADSPSNRDWLKAKGFKSLDDMAKSYREAEHQIRNGNKFTIPAADAKPEDVEAFHKAIGRPDAPDGYAFDLPDGLNAEDLDLDVVGPMRELAHKAGLPASMFKPIAEGIVQLQLDEAGAAKTAEDADYKAWEGKQGAQAAERLAAAQRAQRALGISAEEFAGMQNGLRLQTGQPASSKMMELFAKLGEGMAEDKLLNPESTRRRFGVSGAEAQAEIDRLTKDKEFGEKLTKKDPDAVARWDRLNSAVAADKERQQRAATAAG
jgi:hypothetical protein